MQVTAHVFSSWCSFFHGSRSHNTLRDDSHVFQFSILKHMKMSCHCVYRWYSWCWWKMEQTTHWMWAYSKTINFSSSSYRALYYLLPSRYKIFLFNVYWLTKTHTYTHCTYTCKVLEGVGLQQYKKISIRRYRSGYYICYIVVCDDFVRVYGWSFVVSSAVKNLTWNGNNGIDEVPVTNNWMNWQIYWSMTQFRSPEVLNRVANTWRLLDR